MKTNLTTEEFDAQVVAGSGSLTWTRANLQALFSKVMDVNQPVVLKSGDVIVGTPWKERIDATLRVSDDWEKFGIIEAVIFFTGSVPKLTALGRNRYRVRAAGYYATVGA